MAHRHSGEGLKPFTAARSTSYTPLCLAVRVAVCVKVRVVTRVTVHAVVCGRQDG